MEKNSADKIRVIISTDFPPIDTQYPFLPGTPNDHKSDPDDIQSMVRFLLYTNMFDVEALIASSATFAGIANKQNIMDILDLYSTVEERLRLHDVNYPTANDLRRITFQGRDGTWGKSVKENIGVEKASEASKAIIDIIDKEDERPVWFCVWGDCSNIAQAVFTVQQTRTPEEFKRFNAKMRIFQIAHQDDTIDWLMNEFPEMFIIYSKHTYQGIFRADDLNWVEKNIRKNHGAFGAIYPKAGMGNEGVCEGDSSSFLYLISDIRGISDSENPTQPSWGGQFVSVEGTNHHVDGIGESSITRHKEDFQKDFLQQLQLIFQEDED